VAPETGAPGEACGADLEPVWTRAQAVRTKTFWMLTFICSLFPFAQGGINFHIFPFLTDQGFTETTAVLMLTAIAVFGMVGSALWGALAERLNIRNLLAANVLGSGFVFLLLYWAILFKFDGVWGNGIGFLLAALNGFFYGGRIPIVPIVWANLFGRRSLGSIFSLANPFWYAANALGPLFAGFCFDLFGNYAIPFYFFAGVLVLSGLVTIYLRPPQHPGPAPVK
jgi:MFS family permease